MKKHKNLLELIDKTKSTNAVTKIIPRNCSLPYVVLDSHYLVKVGFKQEDMTKMTNFYSEFNKFRSSDRTIHVVVVARAGFLNQETDRHWITILVFIKKLKLTKHPNKSQHREREKKSAKISHFWILVDFLPKSITTSAYANNCHKYFRFCFTTLKFENDCAFFQGHSYHVKNWITE